MDTANLVSGVIGAVVGAGGATPLVVAVLNHRRGTNQDNQGFAKQMIDGLRADVVSLQEAERKCQEGREELSREVGVLSGRLEGIEAEVAELRGRR